MLESVMVAILKVVAYITCGRRLLMFEHVGIPEAGIQVVQGTVEEGEAPEAAVMRDAEEETGLSGLTMAGLLGGEFLNLRRGGSPQCQHRSYFHLDLPGKPAGRWRHYEAHASDGSPPIEFELYWVSVDSPPLLAGGQDRYLTDLLKRLDSAA